MQAIQARDLQRQGELVHPEIVVRYPQSGETFRGAENYLNMLADYPLGLPEGEMTSLHGESSTAIMPSPLPHLRPTITVFGGDQYVVEGRVQYPEGEYLVVALLRLQGGLVREETWYFASPFDPPEWRQPYVEPFGDAP
jgi:hypothetical protein